MRALVYTAPGKVELEQRPRPAPQEGEAEIAIDVAGICGSDISGFLGHSALRRPPLVLGHELVGRLRDGRRCVQEIAELRDVDANGRYELCSVFTSETTTGRHGIEVEFTPIPDYRPGARLTRKFGLQGMRWMS